MTQEELAMQIGVSQGHVSYVERGEKEIGAEILQRIGREFGKSMEWLLTGWSNRHVTVNRRPGVLPSGILFGGGRDSNEKALAWGNQSRFQQEQKSNKRHRCRGDRCWFQHERNSNKSRGYRLEHQP
jgi:transcriptional regulator with XRE-family HTH domain